MPYQQARRDELGCDSMCLGTLTSARSTLTFIGAAIVGRVSDIRELDKYGGSKRICLLAGVGATALAIYFSSRATSLLDLWIGTLPCLFQQNMNVMRALLTEYHEIDHTNSKSSSNHMSSAGLLGMSSGLSMMIGPYFGAKLLQNGDQAKNLSFVLLTMSALFILLLPTAQTITVRSLHKSTTTSKGLWSFLDVPSARSPAAIFLLSCKTLSTLSFSIYQTIWTVSLKSRFGFGPSDYGQLFSVVGLFLALSHGFLANFILHNFVGTSTRAKVRLLLVCNVTVTLARWYAFQTNNLRSVYIFVGIMVSSVGISSTILTGDTSLVASAGELGSFFGVQAAFESAASILGPLMGGVLSYVHPTMAALVAVSLLNTLVFCLFAFGYERFVVASVSKKKL